jgi:recombination protein RecA
MAKKITTEETELDEDRELSPEENEAQIRKRVKKVMALVSKACGDDCISLMENEEDDFGKLAINFLPTGIVSLDKALGGGVPVGRICEMYGPEAGGKTTVAMLVVKELQKAGGIAALIDVEHAINPKLLRDYGIDTKQLMVVSPITGEEALNAVETLVRSGEVDLVVVDSVSSLLPSEEDVKPMEAMQMGLQARLIGKALRKIVPYCHKNECSIIFINQIRSSIGGYGNPEVTSGGRALKFYCSTRVEIRKGEPILGEKSEQIGHKLKFKITKNKVEMPFKQGEVDLIYGKGIDYVAELLMIGTAAGIISRGGAWYSYIDLSGEEHKWQGKENMKIDLNENQELFKEIRERIEAIL